MAEKFQAIVMLPLANSGLKGFYDLWVLARQFAFDGSLLCRAIEATFQRRQTALPVEPPMALGDGFIRNATKVRQWQAFLRKSKRGTEKVGLDKVIAVLQAFLMPPARALMRGEPLAMHWPSAGPWTLLHAVAEAPSPSSGA